MTCKDCIHYGLCRLDVYFIKLDENEKVIQAQNSNKVEEYCQGFKNKADVVPRSEYDAVVSAVDNSTKEFLKLHDAYQNQKREFEAELNKAKQEVPKRYMLKADGSLEMIPTVESVRTEVAREIFEKIEDLFFDKYLLGNITASLFEYKYAELKKKYEVTENE